MKTVKLIYEIEKLKKTETAIKNERHRLESELAGVCEIPEGKQSKSFNFDNGYKVTIKKNEYYAIKQKEYIDFRKNFDAELLPEKIKYEIDSKKYEALKSEHPEIYMELQKVVEFKINKLIIPFLL